MLTVELGVQCKTPKCKGIPVVAVITVESQKELDAWIKGFSSEVIKCKICEISSLYSRQDLVVGPRERGFFTNTNPHPRN